MQCSTDIPGNGGARKTHYRGSHNGAPVGTSGHRTGADGYARDCFLRHNVGKTERFFLPIRIKDRECRELVAQLTNFAAQRGAVLEVPAKNEHGEVLAELYREVSPLLKRDETISLFYDDTDGTMSFLYRRWPMPDQTVFFVPFKFTYDLKDKDLGLLLRRFLRTFSRTNGWDSVYQSFYFESIMENLEYEMGHNRENMDDCDVDSYEEYRENGEVMMKLKEFYDLPLLTVAEFKAFKPKDEDRKLYDIFAEGLEFLEKDNNFFGRVWSLSQYIDNDNDQYGGEEPMVNPVEELFSIIYDYDVLIDNIVSDISSYYQCGDTEQDILVDECLLDSKRKLKVDEKMSRYMKFVQSIAEAGNEGVY